MCAAKPGPWQYHSDVLTDQSPEVVCTNMIREKLLEYLPQEVPYSLTQVTNKAVLQGIYQNHKLTTPSHPTELIPQPPPAPLLLFPSLHLLHSCLSTHSGLPFCLCHCQI